MNKQELNGALSHIHASGDLKKEVLAMKSKSKPDFRLMAKRAALCAAVLVLLIGTVFFWPSGGKTDNGQIVAVPGVLKVYATELQNASVEELQKHELKEGIGGYGSYIPYSNLSRGIPLLFQIPNDYFGEAEVCFSISADYGWFSSEGVGATDAITVKNGDRLWWQCSPLSNEQEVVDKNDRFYGYVIIYADNNIVGYGVIDYYYLEPENDMRPVFCAIGFSTVCFPLVDGEYQDVTEEYVWKQIEEHRQRKSNEKVVLQWADKR